MSGTLDAILVVSFALAIGGASWLTYQLAQHPCARRPRLGTRGLKRNGALDDLWFRSWEPFTRYLAGWIERLPIDRLRTRIEARLIRAGHCRGITPDELLGLAVLAAGAGALAGLAAAAWLSWSKLLGVLGAALGAFVPWMRIGVVASRRARVVDRGLPAAIDLASLCMSAGLDLPASLAKIVQSAADPSDPLIEELGRVLQELDLGYTRRRAFEGLAERVPTDQVRELVNSVIQAEQKGSPLAGVLTIQAQTQRLHRTLDGEEAASEASLMLVGPMALIFLCVILLLLSPLVVRFMTGEMHPW